MTNLTTKQTDKTVSACKIGDKLQKQDGTIITITRVGLTDGSMEVVYQLSDGTLCFKDDIGERIKIYEN